MAAPALSNIRRISLSDEPIMHVDSRYGYDAFAGGQNTSWNTPAYWIHVNCFAQVTEVGEMAIKLKNH